MGIKVATILILFSSICLINSNQLEEFGEKQCTDYFGSAENEQAFIKCFCRTLATSVDSKGYCYPKYIESST